MDWFYLLLFVNLGVIQMTSKNEKVVKAQFRECNISFTSTADKKPNILKINDKKIPCYESETGVLSDEMIYMECGSPMELAEHLIKQWGTAKIEEGKAEEIPSHNPYHHS